MSKILKFIEKSSTKFNYIINFHVFIEIFEFFKWNVEMLWNLHNSLETYPFEPLHGRI